MKDYVSCEWCGNTIDSDNCYSEFNMIKYYHFCSNKCADRYYKRS